MLLILIIETRKIFLRLIVLIIIKNIITQENVPNQKEKKIFKKLIFILLTSLIITNSS